MVMGLSLRKPSIQVEEKGVLYKHIQRSDYQTDRALLIRYAEVLLNVVEADARARNNAQASDEIQYWWYPYEIKSRSDYNRNSI